jgi:hypothetical protein
MYAFGRFLRWLFIDPIREAIFFATLIVIAAHAMASSWLSPDNSAEKPKKKSPPSPPPLETL